MKYKLETSWEHSKTQKFAEAGCLKSGVSNPAPGDRLSCKVQPQLKHTCLKLSRDPEYLN